MVDVTGEYTAISLIKILSFAVLETSDLSIMF